MAQNHINNNYCINIQYTNKGNKMTKQEINFKLAMSDELLRYLDIHINSTKSFLEVCEPSFKYHKNEQLQKLEFFKDILTCKDTETFFDLTSGKPQIKEVI